MENTTPESKTERIYLRNDIRTAAFLGGPFVGAYMMSHNFKVFKKPEKAIKAWIMCAIIFIVVFGFGLIMRSGQGAEKGFPPYLILLLYSGLISLVIRDYQGEEIELHLDRGGKAYSLLRVIGLIIFGIAFTIFLPGYLVLLSFV